QWVESGLESADQSPALDDRLRDPQADLRLLESALGDRRHGAGEVACCGGGLVLKAPRVRAVERHAVILIGIADVDRAVERDATETQAVRQRILHVGAGGRAGQRQATCCCQQIISIHITPPLMLTIKPCGPWFPAGTEHRSPPS